MTTLQESRWVDVPELTAQQALALEALGQQLAVGQAAVDDEGNNPSLVQCRKSTAGVWQVKVKECIGVLGCQGKSWVVEPKIPMPHLLHFLSLGGTLPRNAPVPVALAQGDNFWRLLFGWLLDQVESLVRRDLQKGYVPTEDSLPYLRGTLNQLQLARGLLRGSTTMLCRFEEFSTDIPPNRLLKSALLMGLRAGILDEQLARRTRRLLSRFDTVSEAARADLRTQVSRETSSYRDAVHLAKHLLRGIHRELAEGSENAWCFLWPTPGAVEEGLREVVRSELDALCSVTKTSVKHGELTFNPDLVVGELTIGDIKYSLDTGGWRRDDIEQLLAFAVAFNRDEALLLNLSQGHLITKYAQVHAVTLARLSWNIVEPVAAAEQSFRELLRAWYGHQRERPGQAPLVAMP